MFHVGVSDLNTPIYLNAVFKIVLHRVHLFPDGELNVLEDILTDAPDQDDELYNPESEHDINEKKGTLM